MSLAGFSLGYVVKTGVAALLFLLFFKWAAAKSNVAGLQGIAAAV